MSAGAGVSGQIVPLASRGAGRSADAEAITVAPGVAPWVGARIGLGASNEAGITYTGRGLRLDARHAFERGSTAVSVGIGASAVASRTGAGGERGVYGGGVDVPVLFGWRSTSDLYALWIGPRGGVEALGGTLEGTSSGADPGSPVEARAVHGFVGGVLGVRGGFRRVHAALEVNASYHRASATIGGASLPVEAFAITPAGAITRTF